MKMDGLDHPENNYAHACRANLYEQNLVYPPGVFEDIDSETGWNTTDTPVKQITGQLMGSVLSFPILCAANFTCFVKAVTRRCHALGIKRPRLADLRCLINGDDILFVCDQELYFIWLEEIALVGFTLSPGKNLVSSTYFTINSTLYTTDVLTSFT